MCHSLNTRCIFKSNIYDYTIVFYRYVARYFFPEDGPHALFQQNHDDLEGYTEKLLMDFGNTDCLSKWTDIASNVEDKNGLKCHKALMELKALTEQVRKFLYNMCEEDEGTSLRDFARHHPLQDAQASVGA